MDTAGADDSKFGRDWLGMAGTGWLIATSAGTAGTGTGVDTDAGAGVAAVLTVAMPVLPAIKFPK